MTITERQLEVLRVSQALAKGNDKVFNIEDACECVDLGLVESAVGYPLTSKGKAILKEQAT